MLKNELQKSSSLKRIKWLLKNSKAAVLKDRLKDIRIKLNEMLVSYTAYAAVPYLRC